jgi:hypothetical protein
MNTQEVMSEKQQAFLESLLAEMKQKALQETMVVGGYKPGGDRILVAPTPETDLESYIVRGFWERAVIAKMTKQAASEMIGLMRGGSPRYVLDWLIEHERLPRLGKEAQAFVMSFAEQS